MVSKRLRNTFAKEKCIFRYITFGVEERKNVN